MQENSEQMFKNYLQKHGLRYTSKRQTVLTVMLQAREHLSIEQIYDLGKVKDHSLGQATVYRTIRHLCNANVIHELRFEDGLARYELDKNDHHDHLVCSSCGKTVAVHNHQLELLKEELVKQHGFKPTNHLLYLYGVCKKCQEEGEE